MYNLTFPNPTCFLISSSGPYPCLAEVPSAFRHTSQAPPQFPRCLGVRPAPERCFPIPNSGLEYRHTASPYHRRPYRCDPIRVRVGFSVTSLGSYTLSSRTCLRKHVALIAADSHFVSMGQANPRTEQNSEGAKLKQSQRKTQKSH